jgi:hypothetical protein
MLLITNCVVTTVSDKINHMKQVAKYTAENIFGAAKCKTGSDRWTDLRLIIIYTILSAELHSLYRIRL